MNRLRIPAWREPENVHPDYVCDRCQDTGYILTERGAIKHQTCPYLDKLRASYVAPSEDFSDEAEIPQPNRADVWQD